MYLKQHVTLDGYNVLETTRHSGFSKDTMYLKQHVALESRKIQCHGT